MGDGYKRLEKSRTNRMLCGVCGGLANYFTIDPTIVRLLWIVFLFASCGTALLAYIVAAIIMPEEVL